MASEFYKEWNKTFLKCKECWQFKELNNSNWYKHNEWFMWYLWRCKDCIKKGRKSERELAMARKRDYNRYHNNPKRKEDVFKSSYKRVLEHLETNKNWRNIHTKACRLIKAKWIRPTCCPICWRKWKVVAHHIDEYVWHNIVFCCVPCHAKIHKWEITEYSVINLLDI